MVPALGHTTLTSRQWCFYVVIPYDLIWDRTLTAVVGSHGLPKLWHGLCTLLSEVLRRCFVPLLNLSTFFFIRVYHVMNCNYNCNYLTAAGRLGFEQGQYEEVGLINLWSMTFL